MTSSEQDARDGLTLPSEGRHGVSKYEWRVVMERPNWSIYHSGAHGDEASAERFAEQLRSSIPHAVTRIERRVAAGPWEDA